MPDVCTLTGSLISVQDKQSALIVCVHEVLDNLVLGNEVIVVVLQDVKFGEILGGKLVEVETVLISHRIYIVRG